MGETGRRGQRIIRFARDKITQTELGWVDFHSRVRARRALHVDLPTPTTESRSLASQERFGIGNWFSKIVFNPYVRLHPAM
jgi:hypothetical protein